MDPSADAPAWKPLGELLVEEGWLTGAELEASLAEQDGDGRKLGQIVVEAGYISIEELTSVLLRQCGIDVSTQDGFGSGLRDELARRGRRREREPVRFEFHAEPEPAPKPEKAARLRKAGRMRIGRSPNRKPLKRLEQLVREFERQERELSETIASLRGMLAPGLDRAG